MDETVLLSLQHHGAPFHQRPRSSLEISTGTHQRIASHSHSSHAWVPSPSREVPLAFSWREMRQRGAAWCASRVTLDPSISLLLMGRALGGGSRAGAFSCLVTRIVPDNSEITALICYIDIVLIDSCSIVGHKSTKETRESEQEAGQR